MTTEFVIKDHLVIPFGTPKWSIDEIRITQVGTDGTYFQSTTPVVYIDKSKKQPYAIGDFFEDNSAIEIPLEVRDDYTASLEFARKYFLQVIDKRSRYEEDFLTLYWRHVHNTVSKYFRLNGEKKKFYENKDYYMLDAMLPIPQAHIYVPDILDTKNSDRPNQMFKIDFAFWTGDRLVGVEIDGWEPEGYRKDVQRDRLLRAAGVQMIHILNEEIDQHDTLLIEKLFPPEFREFISREAKWPRGRSAFESMMEF